MFVTLRFGQVDDQDGVGKDGIFLVLFPKRVHEETEDDGRLSTNDGPPDGPHHSAEKDP